MTEAQRSIYAGGDGSTYEDAVVVNAKSTSEGVPAEHRYISKIFGRPDGDWTLVRQSFCMRGEKYYDVLTVRLVNGEEKSIFFDITAFFGKGVSPEK